VGPGEQVDRSPSPTRTWASKVLEPGADLDALLATCPVPVEKFTTDIQSPLMVHAVTKAAATTTAAVSSIRQVPGPLRPAITTAHTIALGGYRIANATNARPRTLDHHRNGAACPRNRRSNPVLHPVRHQRADRCRRRRLPDHVRCMADQHSVVRCAGRGDTYRRGGRARCPVVRRGLFGTSDQDTASAATCTGWRPPGDPRCSWSAF
jgi:hypothetical protein